eukprot:TRINITY_DN7918_c0_g1_i4.p1 TRINITY_DN7918_c0_g1~~TRINITY_DN7918_c0_g1_i4.p1  ORF type:complete len:351 (-),score=121.79 TRINITY_DN7918_c0_g1_i4:34-1041(-)
MCIRDRVSTQSTWGQTKGKLNISQTMTEKEQQVVEQQQEEKVTFANTPKLFGKWDYSEVEIDDVCFKDYIAIHSVKSQTYIPHTAGRYQVKKFRKAQCPLIERLCNSLQFHGRNTGKKIKVIRVVRQALEIIHIMTGKNPIEVVVNAVKNSGAREDATRIGTGGVVRRQALDVSPMRRVNQSLYYIARGARDKTFRNLQTFSECLADELMNAAKNSPNSYAVKKKDEIEKSAKADRQAVRYPLSDALGGRCGGICDVVNADHQKILQKLKTRKRMPPARAALKLHISVSPPWFGFCFDASLFGSRIYSQANIISCLLYTSPSPRDGLLSRMPSSA